MPFYKVNEYGPTQLSHRHPFHGFGAVEPGIVKAPSVRRAVAVSPTGQTASVVKALPNQGTYSSGDRTPFDFDYALIDRKYYGSVQGYGAYGLPEGTWEKVRGPLLRGALSGLAAYGVARTLQIVKAKKLGLVLGILNAGVGIAAAYLAPETPVPEGEGAPAGQAPPESNPMMP